MVNKTIEQKYKKMTQIEHVLELPDTYIGSIDKTEVELYVFNEKNNKMEKKVLQSIPGLYKIFDEILVNAFDQYIRVKMSNSLNKISQIKVNIDIQTNTISIYNDGDGIEVELHKEHNVYVPELIFGYLLTSANYDKNEEKITGGKNGYGAKLANIYSNEFTIETVDSNSKKKYVQTWNNNMSIRNKPVITNCKAKSYTKVSFKPDLKRFGLKKLTNDIVDIMKKRVYDMTACTDSSVSVYLNNTKLSCKEFEKYVNYFIGTKTEKNRVFEKVNDRWEIVVTTSEDDKLEHTSFVNGIYTYKGGKHVDYIANQIAKKLQTLVSTKGFKKKKILLKQNYIKDNIWVFVKSTIVNPSFDSQTKEYLTTTSSKFGSKCDISDKFIEQLTKIGIIEKAMKLSEFKDSSLLSKTDGKKKSFLKGIPKLDDANWAGTVKSSQCTLILTEGDSAKAFAISGLSVLGRDKYGVFPLRGKLLNVRDCSDKKVADNAEINNIKKILGLQQFSNGTKNKKEYLNTNELRYGSIMILTDQDVDGSHIKGLFINFIHTYWPSLTKIPGFIVSLATPIVKARQKKEVKSFYTLTEFENWEKIVDIKKWNIKYYKGLGTSTSDEARDCFTSVDNKKIKYVYQLNSNKDAQLCNEKIELAFLKCNSDNRKEWLKKYDRSKIIEQTNKNVLYSDFIDKDFIHFSNYDNERSIPSICDGLKPSQRKVLYSVFKRNLKKEIKVAQLAGYVSEQSCYHHGETSSGQPICQNKFNIPVADSEFCYNNDPNPKYNNSKTFSKIHKWPIKNSHLDSTLKDRCDWIKKCGPSSNTKASWIGIDDKCVF